MSAATSSSPPHRGILQREIKARIIWNCPSDTQETPPCGWAGCHPRQVVASTRGESAGKKTGASLLCGLSGHQSWVGGILTRKFDLEPSKGGLSRPVSYRKVKLVPICFKQPRAALGYSALSCFSSSREREKRAVAIAAVGAGCRVHSRSFAAQSSASDHCITCTAQLSVNTCTFCCCFTRALHNYLTE